MAEVTATITWQGYFSGQSSMARESDGCGFTSKAAQWFLDPMVADHLVSRLHRCNLAWPTILIARYPMLSSDRCKLGWARVPEIAQFAPAVRLYCEIAATPCCYAVANTM